MSDRTVEAVGAIGKLLAPLSADYELDTPLYRLGKLKTDAFEKAATKIGLMSQSIWVESLQILHNVYHDTYRLKYHDPKTGKLTMSIERTRQLFDELLIGTCDSLESATKLSDILNRTAALSGAVHLNNSMLRDDQSDLEPGLALFTSSLQFCKLMRRNMDKEKAIKRLAAFIMCCEENTTYGELYLKS